MHACTHTRTAINIRADFVWLWKCAATEILFRIQFLTYHSYIYEICSKYNFDIQVICLEGTNMAPLNIYTPICLTVRDLHLYSLAVHVSLIMKSFSKTFTSEPYDIIAHFQKEQCILIDAMSTLNLSSRPNRQLEQVTCSLTINKCLLVYTPCKSWLSLVGFFRQQILFIR